MLIRILSSLVLLFSILFMPFWVSILLGLAAIFLNNYYWEVIPIFFISDLLYGAKEVKFSGGVFVSVVGALLIFLLAEILKKKLKFYDN